MNGISVGVGDGVIVGVVVGVNVGAGVKVACLVLVGMGAAVARAIAGAHAESNIVIRRKNERNLLISASLYFCPIIQWHDILFIA